MSFFPIMKRELNTYFYSPSAYAITTIFMVISGYFFFSMMIGFSFYSQNAIQNPNATVNITDIIRPLFGNISFTMLLILPILTMRTFSEEKKNGTFELISTYPIKDIDLVAGKFLACSVILFIMLVLTAIFPIFMISYSNPDKGVILSSYLGIFLVGISFISIGLFISSVTENQIVSAVLTFGILLMFWLIGWSAQNTQGITSDILNQLSLLNHFDNFSKGLLDLSDITFYLGFTSLGIFMTLRVLESRRWRG